MRRQRGRVRFLCRSILIIAAVTATLSFAAPVLSGEPLVGAMSVDPSEYSTWRFVLREVLKEPTSRMRPGQFRHSLCGREIPSRLQDPRCGRQLDA
jgi:hypothetical protein